MWACVALETFSSRSCFSTLHLINQAVVQFHREDEFTDSTIIASIFLSCAHSKFFWGVSGSEVRGGGDNSIQFINIGREGDKSFKEWRRKIEEGGRGGRVGDSILNFFSNGSTKKCHFKKLHFGQFFIFVFLIHKFLHWFESFVV